MAPAMAVPWRTAKSLDACFYNVDTRPYPMRILIFFVLSEEAVFGVSFVAGHLGVQLLSPQ